MNAGDGLLIIIGALVACGVYLILERRVTKMLLGMILFGNALNLLLLTIGGPSAAPPIVGLSTGRAMTDPLAQAMILTAIVITMGLAAFVLALGYRSFTQTRRDELEPDPEDRRVVAKATGAAPADDEDEDSGDEDDDGGDTDTDGNEENDPGKAPARGR